MRPIIVANEQRKPVMVAVIVAWAVVTAVCCSMLARSGPERTVLAVLLAAQLVFPGHALWVGFRWSAVCGQMLVLPFRDPVAIVRANAGAAGIVTASTDSGESIRLPRTSFVRASSEEARTVADQINAAIDVARRDRAARPTPVWGARTRGLVEYGEPIVVGYARWRLWLALIVVVWALLLIIPVHLILRDGTRANGMVAAPAAYSVLLIAFAVVVLRGWSVIWGDTLLRPLHDPAVIVRAESAVSRAPKGPGYRALVKVTTEDGRGIELYATRTGSLGPEPPYSVTLVVEQINLYIEEAHRFKGV